MPKVAGALVAGWWLVFLGCHRVVESNPACGHCPATYNVGYRELTFYDSARDRTLHTAFWYPTVDGTRDAARAFAGGAPDPLGRPYPLILFSHGNHGRSTNGHNDILGNAWAARGFVVAAPDHQGNSDYDYDARYDPLMPFLRAGDIRFVLDQSLSLNQDPQSFLNGMIDPTSIGMSGSSFGGSTTLLIAGAPFNLDYQAAWCQPDPGAWNGCLHLDEIEQRYPGRRSIDESDPRIKAALAIVPDGYESFHDDGMAKIQIPTMLVGGELDTLARVEEQQKPMYAALCSVKYLLVQKNADHYAFGNGCNSWDWDTLPLCSGLQAPILSASVAFWGRHLRADEGCGGMLETCVPLMPDVEFSSAGKALGP